ncbi:MAG: phenylalanine--tRNA ligase subunit beta [Bacteroidia bacterium]|nr:MAG: phenylalanine--tRNA ligase subunit beta [Bacteroidia bacterium]
MKVSYNRVNHFLPRPMELERMVGVLTQIGLEVDGVEEYCSVRGGLAGLVVGQVLTCTPHPNADRLRVCTVDVGGPAPLGIVCGAPNVAAGQKVVVAPVGTRLYDAEGKHFTIKKSKLRGEASEGMICAEDEVGLGGSHDGIMVLDTPLPPGTPLTELFEVGRDWTIEIGLTANRADAMSHYGVARDLAAYLSLDSPCRATLPEPTLPEAEGAAPVELGEIDRTGCLRYTGLTIRGVTVAQSPEWVQHTLRAIGLEPINNVVDITNLVLHDLGNPLHAFDLRALRSGRVSLQRLREGTAFTTLDGKERKLDANDYMVCDGDTPLCLAGVLGGLSSGVTDQTTDIFLEAATFEPTAIRRTARRHGLNTDASFRFERGIDPGLTPLALRYAAALIVEVAGGRIEGGMLDHYPRPVAPRRIRFSPERAERVLGVAMDEQTRQRLFEGLEIKVLEQEGDWLSIEVPYYRIDVTRPEDVYEELLRLYGFDRVPLPEGLRFTLPTTGEDIAPGLRYEVAERLAGRGFHEVMAISLNARTDYADLAAYPEEALVGVVNPLSADLNVLRPSLIMGALDAVARNVARQRPRLALFEFGKVFTQTGSPSTPEEPLRAYRERRHLALTLTGTSHEDSWRGKGAPVDVFTLKGEVLAILGLFGLGMPDLSYGDAPEGLYAHGATLLHSGQALAHFGLVSPTLARRKGLKADVHFAEIDWEQLMSIARRGRPAIKALPRFPEVRRDLALLLDARVRFADLAASALRVEGRLIQRVGLFDVYEGEKIAAGKKSYALSFILQDEKGTLNDKAIDRCMQKLISTFEREFGAVLR